ncbi:ABC transporter ATP-binding protein [Methanolobus sp. ZRKC3]|uniref:ABC transporter ATP-binding protein n=1 Tax=Methanolobus sp. ZRKC3 TaxID=3125786 RepID=UPI0032463EC1
MEVIISTSGLSKSFGNQKAIEHIDLELRKGEFVAIFGPNGAGKTTLLKILSTIIEPTKGNVIINRIDLKKKPTEIRKNIGTISHESYLYDDLTAKENLLFFGKMYGMEKAELEKRAHELLEQVDLSHRSDDRVRPFSRGMKQRLSIARALVHNPSILFMDEPYTGLDQHAAQTFEDVLKALDKDKVTKIMISHNIERAFRLCDRVLVMDQGRIVYDRMKDEIDSIELFKNTYHSLLSRDTDIEGISNI